MTISDCFTESGVLVPTKYYVRKWNEIPNHLCLTFNDEETYVDLDKISEPVIRAIFPHVEFIRNHICRYTVVGGAVEQESESKFVLSDSGSSILIGTTDKELYSIDSNSIAFKYPSTDTTDYTEKLKDIWSKLPKKEQEPKEATVGLVGFSDGEYYTIESKIKHSDISIDENYNDDFLPVYKDLLQFLDSRESGLVLLYGSAGTGKTTIIRNLCSQYPKNYIVVPTSLTSRLGDPDFVSFMIDNANSVFILEDCEQVLVDRGVNMFNGAISNILNMSDGLLSDIMNIKFICTFNADIKTIDQALLRKGRCYAKYEFKELSEDKVQHLNEKYNLGISDIKPMTLAEIYNADKTEYSEKKKSRKIGF